MNGAQILELWRRCAASPDPPAAFTRELFAAVPYSGSTGARVEELSPGQVRVTLEQHREVENHLNSIHAVALTNVGELASGLALITALPEGMRSIVIELSTRYLKKARGTLTAECRAPAVEAGEEAELEVEAPIRDSQGEVVALVTARWKVGPLPKGT
ncbi:DUF4442 domain-containing protein [Engelhardtia mirabilis]|uniref:DUF4442 domain-containing protein n=1 Tax=Engelhardtia mirabilis TaxID=2528011 RepID=A0A518BFL7_9BACT|nr:hypothetical protein Pla133_08280 [Planctomycetes bacterium Pla133]QDV00088.1 hypothetical protein Pla86_08270 [Planctomycetes bacterium Pla86]